MSCEIIDYRAAEIDYYKEDGDYFLVSFEVVDNDDVPILLDDLSNVELIIDGAVVAELGSGITVLGNEISIAKADPLIEGAYDYKVVTYDADGARRTIVEGKLIVE